MTSLNYELKIPKDRVAVLIGKEGTIKKTLEQETNTSINVDSKEGDVSISAEDGLSIYTAKQIILAIGRGFNPEIALLLLKTDYLFEVINLKDYARSKNDSGRLKGRVIGTKGKTREIIEEMTKCYVSVYGKTISIIGEADHIASARKAVEILLKGSTHSTVYKFLERERKKMSSTGGF